MEQYDLLVIGGGPGGYSAGIAAAKAGLKVALFEKEHLGGTCLNVGCVPTKYLVDKAIALEKVRSLVSKDIFREAGSLNFERVIKGKAEVVEKLVSGVKMLLKKAGATIINGEAVLLPDRTVRCGETEYQGKNVILATGSETIIVPIPGHELCIDSTDVLNLDHLPASMVVMGGGVIGLELACAFAAYGTEVTVIEMLPEIMGREQKEAVRMLLAQIKKLGLKIRTGARMLRVEEENGLKKAVYEFKEQEESILCEEVLMAVGRRAKLSGIDAAALGLELDPKKCIKVDEHQRTNLPGVYAIGDAAGGLQLAHAAYAEGEAALADILGEEKPRAKYIPACTYTIPCFASVGLNTETAKAAGYEPVMGSFNYAANGMGLAEGENGCVYVICDSATTKTLGVTIVGANASELIAFGSLAVEKEMTLAEWESLVVAHPSLAEMVREAALDAFKKAVHKA